MAPPPRLERVRDAAVAKARSSPSSGLRGSDDQSPNEGCSPPRADRLCESGDAQDAAGATLKLNIIPLSWCSAMWQCAIQQSFGRVSWPERGRRGVLGFRSAVGAGLERQRHLMKRPRLLEVVSRAGPVGRPRPPRSRISLQIRHDRIYAPHAIRSPKANAIAERFVKTVRPECLDWLLILNRRHLERVLRVYVDHNNRQRPHRALDLRPPEPEHRTLRLASTAQPRDVIRQDRLGGLIHEYSLAA
jgi:Integrase core domain